MPRPGVDISLVETPSVVNLPTDSGTAFIVGLTDRGPLKATPVTSLSQFSTIFGTRQSYSPVYDAVESFFREGGGLAYIGRPVGPAAASGSLNLTDNAAAVSLVVTANGPGAWSANYKVAVVAGVAGGTYQIQVTDANNVVLEQSGDLTTQADAITWALNSQYIRLSLGVSALAPAVHAATALSAGTDDRLNITDAQWANAIALFTADLGPGQVLAPGRTTTVGYQQLIAHAEAFERVALLDAPNSGTEATLEASATSVKSRFAGMFAPWVVIPGVVGSTTRTVPPSGFIAGLCARNDVVYGANRASAGNAGILNSAVDISQPGFDDDTRARLNASGVNLIRSMFGTIRNYGWRSLSGSADSAWVGLNNARFYTKLSAELNNAGENFVFDEIDGLMGSTIMGFHTSLVGVCLDHYQRGELFSSDGTPATAFSVDTGSDVNTPQTLANNELHASVSYKNSPFAEWVQINIVKRLVNQSL